MRKYYLIVVVILILIFGVCDDMMQVKYDFQRVYTETFIRTVGATERSGARGTLPQPSPTDGNSIFLAKTEPDGSTPSSDGNAGTLAKPKASLNGANAALGGALTTIVVVRNNYPNDLYFLETLTTTLASTHDIQVEDGETATIEYTAAIRLNCSGTNIINGVHFLKQVSGATPTTEYILNATNAITIDNCTLECLSQLVGGYYEYANAMNLSAVGGTYNMNHTLFKGNTGIKADQGLNANFNNCAWIYTGENRILEERQAGGIWLLDGSGGGAIVLDRCLFANYTTGHWYSDSSQKLCSTPILLDGSVSFWPSTAQDITLNSCHFFNTDSIAIEYGTFGSRADLVANNCQFSGLPFLQDNLGNRLYATALGSANVESNMIDGGLPPMFTYEQDGIDNFNIESFRLQRENMNIPDGTEKYFLDSPLVGAGVSGDDVNPFDESVVFTSQAFNKSLDFYWPPNQMKISNNHQNAVNINDVNGNLERAYDKKRRSFSFTYGDGTHVANLQVKKMGALFEDNGSKRFYPLAEGNNIFEENTISEGSFSDTDNSIVPYTSIIIEMVPRYWKGFWIKIGSDEYYILNNDETKLYLVDKLDAGFPSNGLVNFVIDSMLINTKAGVFVMNQKNFSQFLKGGFLREDGDRNRTFDYQIESMVFDEIEDLKENII